MIIKKKKVLKIQIYILQKITKKNNKIKMIIKEKIKKKIKIQKINQIKINNKIKIHKLK